MTDYSLRHDGQTLYIGFGDGKWWRVDAICNHRERCRIWHEWRDDQYKKRLWWRKCVLSRDKPNTKEARADFGDKGTWEKKLYAWLDGEFSKTTINLLPCQIAKRNCKRIAHRLGLVHWKNVGQFVASVVKYGSKGRERTMFDFNISEATYYRRIALYSKILGFQDGVDMC